MTQIIEVEVPDRRALAAETDDRRTEHKSELRALWRAVKLTREIRRNAREDLERRKDEEE